MSGEIMRLWSGGEPYYAEDDAQWRRDPWEQVPILRVTAKRVYVPLRWDWHSEHWTLDGKLQHIVLDRAKLEDEGRFYHSRTRWTFFTDAGRADEDARWAADEAERARIREEAA